MKHSVELSIFVGLISCIVCVISQVTIDPATLNLAPDVSEDYPVIFNIILFLAIALILSLIAISVAIAGMDPGKDSLIYRVTSAQRFKKDN